VVALQVQWPVPRPANTTDTVHYEFCQPCRALTMEFNDQAYDAIITGTSQGGPSLAARVAAGTNITIIERKLVGRTSWQNRPVRRCPKRGCCQTGIKEAVMRRLGLWIDAAALEWFWLCNSIRRARKCAADTRPKRGWRLRVTRAGQVSHDR
jgi:hypothetical protein